jgi:RimJ/RimL family protein N-acetyltransferase
LYHWTERSADDVRKFVQMFLGYQREQPCYRFQLAIVLRAESRLIGNCGVRKKGPDAFEADMGYEIAPPYWGRGYATEAARAILAFGFDELKLHRISATCLADNLASARLLEKIGMRLEGRLRENERFKGRWWDTLLYAILEHERQAQLGMQ